MVDWKPEYIALLSRLYRTHVLKVATEAGYQEANGVIARAAHVWGSTVGRWIEGIGHPSAVQGERLLRWAATVGWWEWRWDTTATGSDWWDGRYVRVTIAEKLSELIKDSKRGG